MRGLKKVSVGQEVYVPTRLLFPNRTGKWTRYDYEKGIVIKIKRGNDTGKIILQVQTPNFTKDFYAENCGTY